MIPKTTTQLIDSNEIRTELFCSICKLTQTNNFLDNKLRSNSEFMEKLSKISIYHQCILITIITEAFQNISLLTIVSYHVMFVKRFTRGDIIIKYNF